MLAIRSNIQIIISYNFSFRKNISILININKKFVMTHVDGEDLRALSILENLTIGISKHEHRTKAPIIEIAMSPNSVYACNIIKAVDCIKIGKNI